MSKDSHQHGSDSKKHHHEHEQAKKKRPIHHDWRAWVVVILMLAGMLAYVLSNDESLQPGGGTQAPMPAAE